MLDPYKLIQALVGGSREDIKREVYMLMYKGPASPDTFHDLRMYTNMTRKQREFLAALKTSKRTANWPDCWKLSAANKRLATWICVHNMKGML